MQASRRTQRDRDCAKPAGAASFTVPESPSLSQRPPLFSAQGGKSQVRSKARLRAGAAELNEARGSPVCKAATARPGQRPPGSAALPEPRFHGHWGEASTRNRVSPAGRVQPPEPRATCAPARHPHQHLRRSARLFDLATSREKGGSCLGTEQEPPLRASRALGHSTDGG